MIHLVIRLYPLAFCPGHPMIPRPIYPHGLARSPWHTTATSPGEYPDPRGHRRGRWWRRLLKNIYYRGIRQNIPPGFASGEFGLGWLGAQQPTNAHLSISTPFPVASCHLLLLLHHFTTTTSPTTSSNQSSDPSRKRIGCIPRRDIAARGLTSTQHFHHPHKHRTASGRIARIEYLALPLLFWHLCSFCTSNDQIQSRYPIDINRRQFLKRTGSGRTFNLWARPKRKTSTTFPSDTFSEVSASLSQS